MRAEIVRIGNSRGIRIPKPLLAECGLKEAVDLRVSREGLIVAPCRAPRQGWKQAFAESTPDRTMLFGRTLPNLFDKEEWEW
jgi:antitoxin MazE